MVIPIVLIVPSAILRAPIPVVHAPAMFSFFVQGMAITVRLRAVLPVFANRVVKPMLCFLNAVTAFVMVVIRSRHGNRSRYQ
jgi:hypothetical protein